LVATKLEWERTQSIIEKLGVQNNVLGI